LQGLEVAVLEEVLLDLVLDRVAVELLDEGSRHLALTEALELDRLAEVGELALDLLRDLVRGDGDLEEPLAGPEVLEGRGHVVAMLAGLLLGLVRRFVFGLLFGHAGSSVCSRASGAVTAANACGRVGN